MCIRDRSQLLSDWPVALLVRSGEQPATAGTADDEQDDPERTA